LLTQKRKIVKDVKAPESRRTCGGLTNPGRVAVVAFLAVALAGGCHKTGGVSDEGIVPSDPEVAANLVNLSRELRRALPSLNKSTNFEDFVAVSHVEVTPPPPGQKYAISKRWKVILVDAK
jgi:hypothetical protein